MDFELTAATRPGRQLVALAEELAAGFAECASVHDREASYPFAAIAALRERGYFGALVPEEFGGLGVRSVHDLVVASSRLARGDASVAIGVNMHFSAVLNMQRRFDIAVATGDERRAQAFAQSLARIVRDDVVMAAAISEPAQDITRPSTRATRTPEGWRIDGQKIFCTMSPAATVLYTAVSFADEQGTERYGYAQIPTDAPGLRINDDWDAMGMRASGSHSVTLDGAMIAADALRGGFRAGDAVPYMERNLAVGLFHAAASLGIAESAHDAAVASVVRKGGGLADGRTRMLVAESAMDLGAARATLSRAAAMVDEHFAAYSYELGPDDAIVDVFTASQMAKTFVGEAAVRVVDRALGLSGGGGYLNGSLLGRAYRDVRAGAFMHPLGANRAYEFVGQMALGLEPALS